ncbi:growth arrest-specific protein 2-like isoform X2 [Watersipora subatra]|uniref:growth arrest-specific protein 2-like isoform X2 n=1 Tax=Watersipora subatra TaxID=2589382 RepID=UPI00355B767F
MAHKGEPINPETFMDSLDNGVVLCRLIHVIQNKQANKLKEKIKYNTAAGRGGWHARDNAATFIMWCKHFGVKPEILFESNGLITHKQKREVVLSLLELSRFASRYGIEPPAIIQLEKEIEKDERLLSRMEMTKSAVPKKVPPGKSKFTDIDAEVKQVTGECKCSPEFYVEKLTDGIYAMGNKRCLIRRFKGRHMMVRVGGGWDTLDNYLACHDPCRVALFRKAGGQADMLNVKTPEGGVVERGYKGGREPAAGEERFLHVKGKYSRPDTGKKQL